MAKPFFWVKWLAALGHLRRFPGVRVRSAYPFKLIVAADMLNRQRCANLYGPAARSKMAFEIDERESCNNVFGL